MVIVSDPNSFYANNHHELIAFFVSMGVYNDDLEDCSQQFYVTLPTVLISYDPNKASFSTYVFECAKNIVWHHRNNKESIHRWSEITDDTVSVMDPEMYLRIEDFKRYCKRTGSTNTEKVINEIICMADGNRGFTGCSYQCYSQYRDRYLEAERLC